MAEDPRFLLHFKTLAKFKEKLADGTINENRHLVFIKDEKLVWCRGIYYADASKLDNFNSYYNDWSISQANANTITITLKGNQWNSTTRKWEAISKPLVINSATGTISGLMSAQDKRQVDIIDTANFQLSNPTTNSTQVIINASHTDVNAETRNQKTSKILNSATSTDAGILTAQDKRQLDIINSANFELTAPTTTATTVVLHTKRTNVNEEANNIVDSELATARTLPAATQTTAGVMIAQDKLKEDRITGVNYTLSNPESTSTNRTLRITGLNPNNNTTITSDQIIPAATQTLAGLMDTTDKKAVDNIRKIGIVSHMNDNATFTRTSDNVNLNYSCKDVSGDSTTAPTVHSQPIGAVTQSLAGVMTASDKTKLDRITTTDFTLETPTTTATTVTINATKKTPSTNITSNNNINIPLATRTTAGVITSAEKQYLDAIKTLGALTHIKHSDQGGITTDTSKVYLNFNCVGISDQNTTSRQLTIPTATTTTAGVITSTEKKKLDKIKVVDASTTTNAGISQITLSSGQTDTAYIKTETANDSTKVIVEINDNFGNQDTNNADLFQVRGTFNNGNTTTDAANNVRFQVGKTIQARSKNNVLERVLTATDLSDGSVTKVGTATVGSSIKPIYLNAGTPTASSSTVGSTSKPVYLNAGTITASNATIGATNKPVYMNAGTITASTSTIGSGVIPTYMNAGTITASTSTVGSGIKPVYMNAGTITASSSTVGSTSRPVYMNAGTVTQCSTPAPGAWYQGVPLVSSAGVTEIGRYIDFHPATDSTVDYGVRLDGGTSTTSRTFTFGATSGEFVVHTAGTAIGGTAKPVYISNNGVATALTATVGSATTPVYLNAGTITAGTYSFGNASGNAPISNGTVNTDLNADLVDGLHSTAFARADQKATVDLNTVNGRGIMTNDANANATAARHYPITEAGTLFYGTAAYDSANQIYGTYNSNRWFVRGGGSSTTAKTDWKELLHTGNYSTTLDERYYTEAEIDTKVSTINNTISTNKSTMDSHIANKSNPHGVTKAQVGLGNVVNESKTTMFTSPAFTGTPTAPTAGATTNTTQIATTAFVQSAIENKLAANDAMLFKGTIGTGGTVTALPATHNAGWTYKVITAGTYAGVVCEVGDLIMCITDGTTSNNAHWTVVQTNIDGAVTGPASATNGAVATFNGTTGKVIKNTGTIGAANKPMYLNNGVPTACSSTVGSATQPVYMNAGTLTSCTYTLGKSVPANAVFTDTTYSAATATTAGLMSATDKAWLDLVDADNGIVTYIDGSPNILEIGLQYFYNIARRGNKIANQYSFTVTNATSNQPGLMSAKDKAKLDGISAGANAYSLPLATATVRGGVKVGYTANGKNYPVQLSNEQMYVNVPWTDTNTTYSAATSTTAGLMSATDKAKLDGISSGANAYSLPTASTTTLGGIKVGTNLSISNGVLSATNTTYSNASSTTAGLMSATDKAKLDGISSGANKYSLPLAANGTRGGVQVGYVSSGKNYAVQLSGEKMYVNVPWTDTVYTLPSSVAHKNVANTWTAYQDFTAGAGNSGSDMRYKENIKPIDNVLEDVLNLDIISYLWNKNGERTRDTFGVSADQLLEKGGIYAKMVHERMDNEKTKWVEYERFGVLAIKAIQELYKEIQELKAQIN